MASLGNSGGANATMNPLKFWCACDMRLTLPVFGAICLYLNVLAPPAQPKPPERTPCLRSTIGRLDSGMPAPRSDDGDGAAAQRPWNGVFTQPAHHTANDRMRVPPQVVRRREAQGMCSQPCRDHAVRLPTACGLCDAVHGVGRKDAL